MSSNKLSPSSYASTLALLPALDSLTSVVRDKPLTTSKASSSAWNKLSKIVQSVERKILAATTEQLSIPVTAAKSSVSSTIQGEVALVAAAGDAGVLGVLDPIEELINSIKKWLETVIGGVKDWLGDVLEQIKDTYDSISNWLHDQIDAASSWVVTAVNTAINGVKSWLQDTISNITSWIVNTYTSIKGDITNAVDEASEWVANVIEAVRDKITQVVQGIENTYQGLKQSVEDKIQALLDWIERAKQNIAKWWAGIKQDLAHFIDTSIIPNWDKFMQQADKVKELFTTLWEAISSGNYDKAFSLVDGLFTQAGLPAPFEAVRAIVSVAAYFWETVHLQFTTMELAAQKNAQIALALDPLDMSTAAQAVYKGLMTSEQFMTNASLAGLSKDKASKIVDAYRPLPTPGQIQDSFLRGEISLEQHDKLLSQYGMSNSNIELIKQLYLLIPNVSDLIRMAVREAFTPEIATKFGQYEDLPREFIVWGKKQGLSEEWCSRYWAAHWDLPSPSMGFDMLHRGIISNEELTLLLRALDVMPFWRERIIKLSYNPLTRVDVRRMYALGILDDKQVKRAYLDLGYNDEKADWLTQFTVRYYTPEDSTEQDSFKALARSVYSQGYKKHIISVDEYRAFLLNMKYHPDDVELLIQIDSFAMSQDDKLFDLQGYRKDWQKLLLSAYDRGLLHLNEITPMLVDMGYSEDEVNLELSLIDYNRQLTIRNMVAEAVHDQYVSYILDNTQMYALLDQFNFVPEEIDKLQELWDIERVLRSKRPSLTDLRQMLNKGIMQLDAFLDELRGMGYNEKYIPMYAKLLEKA